MFDNKCILVDLLFKMYFNSLYLCIEEYMIMGVDDVLVFNVWFDFDFLFFECFKGEFNEVYC